VTITDPDGMIIYSNPATEMITGFTPQETIGKKAGSKELWGGIMPKAKYEFFWDTIKNRKESFLGEFENKRKNGEIFFSDVDVSPVLNEKNDVIFFVAIERDITKAKEVDKMKTEFISLASHQLRTPLSAMKWFLEMFQTGDLGLLTKEQVEAIDNLNKSNERMIALVNSLLNISRIESGRITIEPEMTDVNSLIKTIIGDFKNIFELKNQKLFVEYSDSLPKVSLDPKLTREVISNLLTNANKYTDIGGTVTISVEPIGQDIKLTVRDSGYGIPEAEKNKVFQRFYRATNIIKKVTDGTGLGLYLCKIIIDSSGGKIGFDSAENKGSTFWFTIPLTGVTPKEGVVSLS
jgi:PAS domain S-box-containing protein